MKVTPDRQNQCPRRRASDYDQDKLLSFTVGVVIGWGAPVAYRVLIAMLEAFR